MSKLTVMEQNQVIMGALGINPYPFASPSLNRFQLLSPYFVAVPLTLMIILSTEYAFRATHLPSILEAFIPLLAGLATLSSYFNMRWKMNSVGQINLKLQEIVDQAAKEKSVATIYWMTERRCHRINKRLTAYVLFQQSAFVPALFYSLCCVCVGNFDTSTYYLPLTMSSPFDTDSLCGWYLFWALQFMCGVAYLCGTLVVTAYFVCCCFYLEALCDHFDHLIESFDAEIRRDANSLSARKALINAIDHHCRIYEVFNRVWVALSFGQDNDNRITPCVVVHGIEGNRNRHNSNELKQYTRPHDIHISFSRNAYPM